MWGGGGGGGAPAPRRGGVSVAVQTDAVRHRPLADQAHTHLVNSRSIVLTSLAVGGAPKSKYQASTGSDSGLIASCANGTPAAYAGCQRYWLTALMSKPHTSARGWPPARHGLRPPPCTCVCMPAPALAGLLPFQQPRACCAQLHRLHVHRGRARHQQRICCQQPCQRVVDRWDEPRGQQACTGGGMSQARGGAPSAC